MDTTSGHLLTARGRTPHPKNSLREFFQPCWKQFFRNFCAKRNCVTACVNQPAHCAGHQCRLTLVACLTEKFLLRQVSPNDDEFSRISRAKRSAVEWDDQHASLSDKPLSALKNCPQASRHCPRSSIGYAAKKAMPRRASVGKCRLR